MWILKWLPNWIFYAILLAGIAGYLATYFMKFIPFVYVYRTTIQAVSVVAIVLGTYMAGAISNEEAWLLRVAEMQAKVDAAAVESLKENNKIDNKIADQQQVYKDRQVVVRQYIDREVTKYDADCKIPTEFISIINKAATK
jgi:hypothetical protein